MSTQARERVVVDIDALISGLRLPRSIPGQVVRKAVADCHLLASDATIMELADVLGRPKFDPYLTIRERQEFLRLFNRIAEGVPITRIIQVRSVPRPASDAASAHIRPVRIAIRTIHEHPHEENRHHLAPARGALDRARKRDNLTRAEALREAIRRYVSQGSDRRIPVEDALPDEIEAIEEGQAQIARGEYVLLDDLKHEMGRPPKQ